MSNDDRPPVEGTTLDPRQAPKRLQEGLVPDHTAIYLRIEEGLAAGKTYTLSLGGVYLIGRKNADVVVDDDKVSRKHAELGLYGPDAYVLRDLASTNGTWVNDRRISEKCPVKNGDAIRVGDTLLRFSLIEGSIPLTP